MTEERLGQLALWIALNIGGLMLAEVVLGFSSAVDSERDLKIVALAWFAVLGAFLGAITVLLFPTRVLRPGPFPYVSLLVVPLLLAGAMAGLGWLRRRHSHLATWYGGAVAGAGLAAGRLIALAFAAEVAGL